jgi:ribosomal protein S18 acetylase RimI-like enzyme
VGAAMALGGDLAAATRVTEVRSLDLSDDATVEAVVALQREAYAVEAALIGSDGIPALTEPADAIRAAGEDWLGVADPQGLIGAVSWRELDDGTIDIHRLVVARRAFRRGVGTALLDVLNVRFPDRPMVVSTGRDNVPARQLYARRGFVVVREREVVQGLWIAEHTRPAGPPRGARAEVTPG